MNYIQIEIGGQLRGLKFNQGAHVEIQTTIEKAKANNDIFNSYAVFYGGLIGNCFVKGVEPDFTFEDVCDWCDKIKTEDVISVLNCYKDSLPAIPEEDKKKITKPPQQKSTKSKASKRH